MNGRVGAVLASLIIPGGCSDMKATDFQGASPQLKIEEYFQGETHAWGIFEDRFGNLRRQFTVAITGTWDGSELHLDEQFLYSDGERDERVWRISKTGEHSYQGQAGDVIGTAQGEAYGNAMNWRYDLDLKVGGSTVRVHFNDWLFLQPSGVLLNRARVSKFGIEIGEVTLFFAKAAAARPAGLPGRQTAGSAASRVADR